MHEIMGSSEDLLGKEVLVKGWCRTVRDQKAFSFIELNDGSLPSGIQVSLSAPWPPLRQVQGICQGNIYLVFQELYLGERSVLVRGVSGSA